MQSERFRKAAEMVGNDTRIFVDFNLAIIDQICDYLEAKKWNQKKLALALGKSESEISKWFSGTHNFTLHTLSKLQDILGETIITTPKEFTSQFDGWIRVEAEKQQEACIKSFDHTTIKYHSEFKMLLDPKFGIQSKQTKKLILMEGSLNHRNNDYYVEAG